MRPLTDVLIFGTFVRGVREEEETVLAREGEE